MLNRESLFRGDTALTARQRQTAVFVAGIVAVLGALVLSFTGAISALIHRDDPVAMQAVSSETVVATTVLADGSADAGLDRIAPELGGAESGAAAPTGDTTAPAAGGGRFTGTYKPSKGASSPSPLAPTATSAAPGGDPGSTSPTTQAPGATTASTAVEPTVSTTTTGAPSSSTTTTRPPATTTTTTRVTVTEATVPPTVLTTTTTRPPTTSPPTIPPSSAPPSSATVIPGPVA